jgi:hypothetical protein
VSGLRAPVVAGVGGGVGTTTLAVGLRGHDGARERVDTADILACRGTLDSLARAAEALDHAGPGPRPVLAVTLDGARARGALRARLELLGAGSDAVVLLPHVRRWRTLADPVAEVASLLREPIDRLPRPLRAYAAALRELAGAVATSGRLHAPPPAAVIADAPPTAGVFGNGGPRVAVRATPEVLRPEPGPARQRGVRIVLPVERAEQAG